MKKVILYCLLIFCILMLFPVMVFATDSSTNGISTSIIGIDEFKSMLEGEGIKITNMKLTGNTNQIGKFSGASGVTGFKNIGEGLIMSTGMAKDMFVPASSFLSTNFASYAHGSIFDEVDVEFDAVSETNFISFQYIFASEEFDQAPQFNDLMTIEVNGKNIALIPSSDKIISINDLRNTKYHYDNYAGTQIGYLGYTPLLSCQADVTPGEVNHFKISIKDLGDPIYDSALFIKAHSLSDKKAPKAEVNPDPSDRGVDTPVKFSKEISAVKLTLSNKTVLYDITVQDDTVIGSTSGVLMADNLILTVDDEILHGAVLEIEYKMTLENCSEFNCLKYNIKDLIGRNLLFESNHKLLTESASNASKGWEITEDGTIECKYDENIVAIPPGQKIEKKIVLSTLLSVDSSENKESEEDNKYLYKNSAEAEFTFLRSEVSREANAKNVFLLPPFGQETNAKYYILGIIISILLMILFVCIKKYIVNKK